MKLPQKLHRILHSKCKSTDSRLASAIVFHELLEMFMENLHIIGCDVEI